MDMGIEPLLLSSSLRLVLAQRLVRRLCPDCKAPNDSDNENSHKPVGCPSCQNIGYRGRIGIFELLSVDDTVRQMIADGATEQQIEAHAFVDNALLASSGRALVASGETTTAEVLRVARLSE